MLQQADCYITNVNISRMNELNVPFFVASKFRQKMPWFITQFPRKNYDFSGIIKNISASSLIDFLLSMVDCVGVS